MILRISHMPSFDGQRAFCRAFCLNCLLNVFSFDFQPLRFYFSLLCVTLFHNQVLSLLGLLFLLSFKLLCCESRVIKKQVTKQLLGGLFGIGPAHQRHICLNWNPVSHCVYLRHGVINWLFTILFCLADYCTRQGRVSKSSIAWHKCSRMFDWSEVLYWNLISGYLLPLYALLQK